MQEQAPTAGGALSHRNDTPCSARPTRLTTPTPSTPVRSTDFFGDEAAAEAVVEMDELKHRVKQAESQISSQFTSLATYAQIAQEQVEVARSEARALTERSEQRLTSLIERERADRISSFTGVAPAGSAPDVTARLDALEHSVAQIRKGLDECLQRQKALAEAIATMFECAAESHRGRASRRRTERRQVNVEVSETEVYELSGGHRLRSG